MDDLERWSGVLANVVYVGAVVAMLLLLMPGVRQRGQQLGARTLAAWQYGRWLERQPPAPRWFARLALSDLPDEGP